MLALIDKSNPDIICGCESHLNQSYYSSEIFPDLYIVIRKDRVEGAGGVFIAVKRQFNVSEECELNTNAELVWAKVSIPNTQPIYVCSYYRSPDNNLNPILQLQISLNKLVEKSLNIPSILLMGDFNFPSIVWSDGYGLLNPNPTYGSELNNVFLETMNDASLEQYVTEPTRQNNILDLVLSNNNNIHNLNVVPGISDHDAIQFQLSVTHKSAIHKPPHKVALYHRCDLTNIKRDLQDFANYFLQSDSTSKSVDTMWSEFKDAIHECIDKHVPHRTVRSNKSLPWINHEIKKDMKTRKRLYNAAKKNNRQDDWNAYKRMKNLINVKLKDAHNNYYGRLFDNSFGGNKRQFWKYIKAKRKDTNAISTIMIDGSPHTDTLSKAEALNKQFKSVFTHEDIVNIPTMATSSDTGNSFPIMSDITFSLNGIQQALCNLQVNKASGPDRIPPYILKNCAEEISPVLKVIFTKSFTTGILPKDWLTANICPVHKKGRRNDASNYRPISLTSICSKVLEHIIYHNIMNHINNNNILIENQHGFRANHSCVTQLLTLTEDISYALDHRKQVDVILLDFAKAFNTVPHQRLLTKLHFYGIQNDTYNWIKAWLSNRTQQILLDGITSSSVAVTSGVPQGTVLGPLMFLLYINDITTNIKSPLRIFADDRLLYSVINSPEDTIILQQDLDQISHWVKIWQLRLNVTKCALIRCSRSLTPIVHHYTLNNSFLKETDQHLYLGIMLKKTLSWSSHISNI